MIIKTLKRSLPLMAFALALAGMASRGVVNSQDDKPVEQVKKNIQVLKGMPDSQLRPLMNYFNAALGVRCNFCHTMKDGRIDFVSDEHEHKGIARQMIKMVQETNKNSFGGRNQISCFTCHQGRGIPAAAPTFPLAAPAGPPPGGPRPPGPGAPAAGAPPAGPPPAPPSAESVWDKYVLAVGGKEAAAKLKTRALTGTFTNGNNQTMKAEVKFAAPGKLLTTMLMTTPDGQTAEIVSATDGATGFAKDPRGVRALNPVELNDIKALADVLNAVKLSEPLPKLATGRGGRVNERATTVLRFEQNQTRTTLFFDAETGLLLRRIDTNPHFLGAIPQQYDFEDYKEVDGVKLPMTVRIYSVDNAITGTWKFTEVKHNVAFDGVKFTQ
ncbi:MAG: c-type cytochrome [Acidobacteria bacterium]|nr:c-type cytochrome [Acidobacteriota bacterium]